MLEIKKLNFRHNNSGIDILKEIEFNVTAGGVTTILGPNGSGKTTLFKCITSVWKPQSGEILFKEKRITKLSDKDRAKIFAVVSQEHEPAFSYSVFDIALMGRSPHIGVLSSPSHNDYCVAEKALETVGISYLRDKTYTKISGGERQLVMIARSLSQESPILLLDEPTAHLDFRHQVHVLKKIRNITIEKGLTVLMTLHDPNLAMLFSDKVVMLSGGSIVSSGNPQTVITEDVLKSVYDIDVSVIPWNGTKVIYPCTK